MDMKENLINALTMKEHEKVPVTPFPAVCMKELMDERNISFPTGHTDPKKMAELAASGYEATGIEGITLPFDLGFEAEAIGCKVEIDHDDNSSTILEAPCDGIEDLEMPDDYTSRGRFPTVIKAAEILHEQYDDKNVPLIGAMSGPFTVLGQVLGVEGILKMLNTDYFIVEEAVDEINTGLIEQIKLYNDLGMDSIVIYEPNGSPDLLDPDMFYELIVPFLEELSEEMDVPGVLHICGDTTTNLENMLSCGFEGISIADDVDMKVAKQKQAELGSKTRICGNISTTGSLFMGSVAEVEQETKQCLEDGVDVLGPSCMVAYPSPVENVKAMVRARDEFCQ